MRTQRFLVLSVSLLLVIASGSGLLLHNTISAHRDATKKAAQAQRAQLQALNLAKHKSLVTNDKSTSDTNSSQPVKSSSSANASTATTNAIKYSTSSDPRSTTYSTTPPAANPASFQTKITQPGQVAPGTLVSYNATKGEKTYYGGDLILSPSTVTISKSTNSRTWFTVALPDGGINRGANLPWDDRSPVAFVAFDGTGVVPGVIVSEFVQLNTYPGLPANGTYQVHLIGGSVNPPTSDGWEYDGFLTVIVTD